MTTIRIMREVKEMLNESSDKGALDDKLNELMDKSSKPVYTYENKSANSTNMDIRPETLERLKEYKIFRTESHSDTILRLLNEL